MSKQQQDKSKDQIIFMPSSPFELQLLLKAEARPLNKPLPSSPEYFCKFNCPSYANTSAFCLYKPPSDGGHPTSLEAKSQINRKHRGNYRKYTVTEKQEAVRQILEGGDAKQISEKYGIPRRNLLRWKKNGCERKEGGGRPTDAQMELTLYKKIENQTLANEKDIRGQAKKLSKLTDFKASKGWYCKFSRRYNQWKRQKMEESNCCKQEQMQQVLLAQISEDSDSSSGDEGQDLNSPKQD